MIKIKEIAFTGYPVTDMPRARSFYEGTLGLKPAMTFGEDWVEYDIGSGTLAITSMSKEWKPSSDGPSVALEVENFEEALAVLRAAGTPFALEPFESPVCWLAVVGDPDGNSVAIHKRKATAPAGGGTHTH